MRSIRHIRHFPAETITRQALCGRRLPGPGRSLTATGLRATALVLIAITAMAPARADEAVPADAAPRWWKGNIHTHTFWSDGNDFPEMVAEWYRTRGYNFLALSDHNVLAQGIRWMPEQRVLDRGGPGVIDKYLARFGTRWVERRGEADSAEIRLKPFDEFRPLVEARGQFLMIPAEEISDAVDGKPVHINASNIAEAIQPVGGRTVSEAIQNNLRAVQEQAEKAGRSILAHLNHPNFGYAVTPADLAHATLERHFEVFNGHPSVNQLGNDKKPSIEQLWDIANVIRLTELQAEPLFGVATDDSHDYHSGPGSPQSSRPGRGWVMVRASHLTPEKIIQALQVGDFYASSGVVLRDVRFDGSTQTLKVEIEPDGDATFTTRFIGSVAGENGETTQIGAELAAVDGLSASYTFGGNELYVRAVITSSEPPEDPVWESQRQQAWTQPVGWQKQPAAP
jgi:predicted metal-dependent phosphoesterase TrpH